MTGNISSLSISSCESVENLHFPAMPAEPIQDELFNNLELPMTDRAPSSPKDIEARVLPIVQARFKPVKKWLFINHDLKSIDHEVKIGLTKKLLKRLVRKSSQVLADQPIGTGQTISTKNNKGKYIKYYSQLRYNNSNELHMTIQRIDFTGYIDGRHTEVYKSCGIHNGKLTVLKQDKDFLNNRYLFNTEKEYNFLYEINKRLNLEENETIRNLLLRISPDNQIVFPFIKPSKTLVRINNKIRGMFLERGTAGNLFDEIPYLTFIERIQVAKYITVAVIILKYLKIFHFDIKPENIVLFRDGILRAKLIDFAFAEKHLTSEFVESVEDAHILLRGSSDYIDQQGIMDSVIDKENINIPEKNLRLQRRDLVGLARVWKKIFCPPNTIEIKTNNGSSEWIVKYDPSHEKFQNVIKNLYENLPSFDLTEAISALEDFEAKGSLC